MVSWIFIALSTLASIGGQLTLKHAMQRIAASGSGRSLLLQIMFSPWVIIGMAVYGCGVIFWLVALSHLDVSFVYPFASLSYVGIIIGSHFIFNEHIPPRRLAGIGVIICGVILIGFSAA
jgi:multidrug transporter EmrE-like cation transporter